MTSPSPEPQRGSADNTIDTVLSSIRRILNDDKTLNKTMESTLVTSAIENDELTLEPSMMVSSPAKAEQDNSAPQDDLMGAQTIAAAEHSLNDLQTAFSSNGKSIPSDTVVSGSSGMTIEDMVRTEVRSMVRTWLDAHLPSLVEILVRAEIARLRPNN
ncbi:DUF2497 domain-containing protein [Gluconobacter cerinus]|uniref:DUF2497 domain-containing protein n=1 Tax=Gluconobacter cerinus TaxID=38307 RepID=A0A1B6VP29_9PROT|nr:DUF2497 domain-containing protein [Gluconobacter cerinus]OAJ68972.1 hypothetical protein A0123_00541 [Gluconobacter cerinus]